MKNNNNQSKKEYMIKYNQTEKAKQSKKRYMSTEKGKQNHKVLCEKHRLKIKGIYGAFDSDTNQCLYIGGSKAINGRLLAHRYATKHLDKALVHRPTQYKLYSCLAQHSSIEWKIIEECPVELINQKEEYYISILNPLYNIYIS